MSSSLLRFPVLPLSAIRSTVSKFAAVGVLFALAGCVSAPSYTPLINAEPAAGEVIAERVPRTLRLFYAALPAVGESSVELAGPEGDYTLRGLHTMGADDLMMEIYQPSLTNGTYTVRWQTKVEGDDDLYSGEYQFEVAIP